MKQIVEPQTLTRKRTEYGKLIRKDYELGKIKERRNNMTQYEPRNDGVCGTLTTVLKDNYLIEPELQYPLRIRKLTPRECFRLMGFSDTDFDKASSVNSSSQLYKQAGNSIVVNVIEAIFKNMMPR